MDDFPKQTPLINNTNVPFRSSKKSKRLILIIFLFILIVVGVFGGNKFLQSGNKKEEKEITPTPVEEEFEFPTETPTPIETPTVEPTPTITPKPTTNPVDKETGLDRGTISVDVKNGSGETGAASKASETLKALGYGISSIGNADNSNYENVTIQVKSNKSNFLALLKKDLGFSYTIGTSSADLSDTSAADALVIIGK